MSVITSLPVTPNRMRIVWLYLKQSGRSDLDGEDLRRLFSPRALQTGQTDEEPTGTTIADDVVREMRNIGLLERGEDGSLLLSASAAEFGKREFLGYLEALLLDPAKAERQGQSAFPLALSWFLTHDPANPFKWGENYVGQVRDECGEDSGSFELTNLARSQQFVHWARYLGFAWLLETQGVNVVFPDPTLAIQRHLPMVIDHQERQPLQDVMNRLAQFLPVIEGGTARHDVESRLAPDRQRPDGHLSRSTSFALERLESRGQLRLEQLADAPGINLDRVSGQRPVSHITWLERE